MKRSSDLPLREMLAKHRENPSCASCHARFDSFGLAFEGYGPVGERRTKDLAGRPVDTQAVFPGGSEGSGSRVCRATSASIAKKIFWITLAGNCSPTRLAGRFCFPMSRHRADESHAGRERLSLQPLVETIVTSPQFLNKRSPDTPERTAQKGE